jgi:hypothetical protein
MSNCMLNVSDHEYGQILQLNHNSVVWTSNDRVLLAKIGKLLGRDIADELRRYDECRMEKSDAPQYRVEPVPDFSEISQRLLKAGG